jgi:uncharacterized cysteine cluster protein YcgN (CxxCxxCC family)
MTEAEWESLCDGCGRCCLVKLEDEETGKIHYTDVACRLFDAKTCRCRDYARRTREMADCVALSPENIASLRWMPPTCAYRLLAEGKTLPVWHPLVSGRMESVVEAGISVRGRISGHEGQFSADQLIKRIRRWPGESRARKPGS